MRDILFPSPVRGGPFSQGTGGGVRTFNKVRTGYRSKSLVHSPNRATSLRSVKTPPLAPPLKGEGNYALRLLLLVTLFVASPCNAQLSLDAELDRAAARYAPAATPAPEKVDALVAEAAEHYRAKRIDDAVAALDRAAGVAFAAEATGKAFELSLTAAEMLRKAGSAAEAAERFHQAALSNTRDPRAAQAHATAIEVLGATLDGAPAERLDQYAKLLDQHLSIWPESAAADTVRWRRVELVARRGQWDALLAAVRSVGPDDPHFDRSRELLVSAYAGLLVEDRSPKRFDAARDELQPLIFVDPRAWPAEWSPLQREAALVLARAAVVQHAEGLEYGKRLLVHALDDPPPPEPAWRRRAATLLVVAMLAGGEMTEADDWLRSVYKGKSAEREQLLITTLNHLRTDPGVGAGADRLLRSLGALEGEVRQDAQSAAALVAAGRDNEALQLYKQLAAERPDDRGVQIEYAKLLGSSTDAKDREASLGRWRLIESRSEAGSDGWFEARLQRLRLLIATGKRDDAKKLLALTRLLAPTLGGDERRAEFEQIAQQLEQASQ